MADAKGTTEGTNQKPRAMAAATPVGQQDHNARMRQLAHQRLDEMFEQAEKARFWGTIGIELTWEGGTVRLLHRRLEGRDKP